MRWLTRDRDIRVRAGFGFVVDSREIALWGREVRLEIWLEISTSNPLSRARSCWITRDWHMQPPP